MQYAEKGTFQPSPDVPSDKMSQRLNTSRAVMDPKSIRQCKADQARILEQFNTPYYSILEYGAENMLVFEKLGKVTMQFLSGSFITDTISKFIEALNEDSEPTQQNSEEDTITMNKMDIIQKQLDAIVAQMEKVKEESRRKSEELEMLRRTMAQSGSQPPSEARNTHYTRVEETKPTNTTAYDDYVMDFSKPAGYQPPPPPPPPRQDSPEPEFHVSLRPRPADPEPVNEAPSARPPIPPPPRRAQSVDAGSLRRRRDSQSSAPPADMDRQRSMLMEEIRRSANARILRKTSEEKRDESPAVMNREVIVKGREDESSVTKRQRQLKLSLNDEIRLKMQERLKVMNESDDDNAVNEVN